MRHDPNDPNPRDKTKKSYAEPRLIEYGSITKLTQTGTGSRLDGSLMKMVGTCL